MITFEGISKRYGRTTVLERASFEARAGEVTLLTGPNGAGKSTSLKIIAGLVRPDEGSVRLCDVDLFRQRTAALAHLSYLPQTVSFHPALTPRQIVKFYARLRGARDVKVDALIGSVGLADRIDAPIKELSGGMVQRIGIAVLLLPDAPILLLDEPGISLDPEWREWLQDVLRAEADRGKTVLLTTHYVGEWQQADRELRCENATIGGARIEAKGTSSPSTAAAESGFSDIIRAIANAI